MDYTILLSLLLCQLVCSDISQLHCHISSYRQHTDIVPDNFFIDDYNVTMLDCLELCCSTQGCDGLKYEKLPDNNTYECRLFNCAELSDCPLSPNNFSSVIILDPGDLGVNETKTEQFSWKFDLNCTPFVSVSLLALVVIFFFIDTFLIVAVVYFRKRDALVFYVSPRKVGKYRKLSNVTR